jgi:hypothetical protein
MEDASSLFGPETFGPETYAGLYLSREEGVSFPQLDRHLEKAVAAQQVVKASV